MLPQVPQPMFVDYFSAFTSACDSVISDDSCLSTADSDGSNSSVGENIILSETGEASGTESSNVPILDCRSSNDKCLTWYDFVIRVDNNGSILYERMS